MLIMKRYLTLVFFLFVVASAGFAQEQVSVRKSETIRQINGIEYYIHVVEKGQTLYSISKAYLVTQDELQVLNPQISNGLQLGQELRIPMVKDLVEKPVVQEPSFIYHIVKKSETLSSIARIYSVDEDAIRKFNSLKTDDIQPDAVLRIPMDYSALMKTSNAEKPVQKNEFTEYQIAEKETLYSISKKFGVTIADLLEWNPELQNGPKIGQKIQIGKPTVKAKNVETNPYIEHKVSRKESLYGIARMYQISIDSLKLFNPGLTEAINDGQVILIPKDRKQAAFITHTPQHKEKTSEIAENYSISEQKLKEANPGIGEKISKDETIKIPVSNTETEKLSNKEPNLVNVKEDPICPADYKYINQEFKVAIMLPFSLSEYDSLAFNQKGKKQKDYPYFKYIQFYEGALLALDTLEKQGLKAKIHVYDVSKDVDETKKLLLKHELKSMDLFICVVFSKNFELIADFAKKQNIPVVNAISKRDDIVKDNPMVFKAMPSDGSQAESIVNYLKKKHVRQNVIILRANKYQGVELCSKLNTQIKNLFKTNYPGSRVVYLNDSLSKLGANLKPGYDNILISVAENQAYIMDLLRVLNNRRDTIQFSIIGLPAWDEMNNLETNLLSKLNVHLVTPLIVDYSDEDTKAFIQKFHSQYMIEPDELAFKGYDLNLYFMNALMRFGTNFQSCLQNLKVKTLQTSYLFERQGNHGHINSFWNLYYIQGYSPVVLR